MPSDNDISESEPIIQYVDENDSAGCLGTACNPRKPFYRYFALVFMCLLSFGSYFCSDNPAAVWFHLYKSILSRYI